MKTFNFFILSVITAGFLTGCYTQLAMFHKHELYYAEGDEQLAEAEYDTVWVEDEEDLYRTQYEPMVDEYHFYSNYCDPFFDWPFYSYIYWPHPYPNPWYGYWYPFVSIGYYPGWWWYDPYPYWGWGGGGNYTKPVTPRPFTKGGFATRAGGSNRVRIGSVGNGSGSRISRDRDKINSGYAERKNSGRTTVTDNPSNAGNVSADRKSPIIVRSGSNQGNKNTESNTKVVKRGSTQKERKYYVITPKSKSNENNTSSDKKTNISTPKRSVTKSSSSHSTRSTYTGPARSSSSSSSSSSTYSGGRSSSSGSSRSSSSSSSSRSSNSGSGSRSSSRR